MFFTIEYSTEIVKGIGQKIQRFLSQPFFVAEQFTGTKGQYVPIKDTIRSCKEILAGKYDHINEQAFYLKGSIEDVVKAHDESNS